MIKLRPNQTTHGCVKWLKRLAQITWIDYIGSFGTLMVVLAYFLTQLRIMSATDLAFPVINLIGSLLIGASLYFNFNLASALIEFFWVLISIFGIAMWLKDNLFKKEDQHDELA